MHNGEFGENFDILELLLKMSNETEIGPYSRHATFFDAIANGDVEIVRLLLQQGASATKKDEATGLTPLALAAANGQEKLVKALLQREDVIANWMFETWKEDVRREAGGVGEKFASNTPRAVAFRNGHFTVANLLARSCAALEPYLDFSNLSFCKGIDKQDEKLNDRKSAHMSTATAEESHLDSDEKRGRSRDQGTKVTKEANHNKYSPSAVFHPLILFTDDPKRKMRTEESHGNLGVPAPIFGRKARSVSI